MRAKGTRCAPYKVRTHGHRRDRFDDQSLTYRAWTNMRARCRRQKGYVGRVFVCERWGDYGAFLVDMGERPSAGHSLDRIDNAGGYSPENCRWATNDEQARNKSTTVMLTHPATGARMCAADLAADLGISKGTLHWRLKRWPLARALTPGDHRLSSTAMPSPTTCGSEAS